MNAPNRYELFVLEEGERPVEVTEDTKIPNAATIKILKQDHTLGNMIRAQLLSMPQVLFAGYKVPHPLQPHFLIKVQTDGSVTPAVILEQACTKLIGTLASLETKFKREFTFRDVDGAVAEDAYGTVTTGGAGWTEGRDYLDF
ncbi:DNA-directed RNA polymerase II subunit RPB11 [Sparassis crispa]|uniref:DNA-directed RNA polymerase II subunit RPB11 n=2 Tax=Sparassis crispa TaxID=139825 RepID=A0A401H2E4_9APHY|nr:DNA-directed RNA polymerase II subunit RPB11 [Sparassis crispa]GBE88605.1 DNA-directed RNA polymerase II subunit RPB11 [Sparassis crispa]